jgi:hypothetical protein
MLAMRAVDIRSSRYGSSSAIEGSVAVTGAVGIVGISSRDGVVPGIVATYDKNR